MEVIRRKFFLTKVLTSILFFLFCGLIPFIVIHREFPNTGSVFAKIYSGLFYFPLFVGFLLPFFLVSPSIFAFRNLNKVDKRIFSFLLIFLTLGVAISDMTEGGIAIWELKEEKHSVEIELANSSKVALDEFSINGSSNNIKKDKETYESALNQNISFSSSSYTRYTYFISIFIQVFFFILVFIVPSALLKNYYKNKTNNQIDYIEAVNSIIFSQIIISFWLLMKMSVDEERSYLYPTNDISFSNTMILLALLFSMVCCLRILWTSFKEQIKNIFTIITTFGLSVTFVKGVYSKKMLLEYFGKNGVWSNYLFILLFLLVVMFALSSSNPKTKSKDQEFHDKVLS